MKKKYLIIIIISLIIFFEPQLFKEENVQFASKIDMVYKMLKLISTGCIIYIYMMELKKVSKLVIFKFLIQAIFFISTIINNGDIIRLLGPSITTITMAMIGELIIKKGAIIPVLKTINKYFLFCYIINLISIILIDFTNFRNITNVYFLGIDNRFIFTFLPWIFCEGIVSYMENKKFTKKFYIVLILIEIILIYKLSLSAMFCTMLFFMVSVKKIRLEKYNKITFFIIILLNLLLVLFNVTSKFSNILSIMNRDVTLSGRTFLWKATTESIKENLFIGSGMKSVASDKLFFYNSTAPYYFDFCKVTHPHNLFLSIAYRGGLISLSIFLIIVYRCLKKIKLNIKNPVSKLLYISIIVIMILSLFDTLDFAGLYFIFAFCWFIEFYCKRGITND